MKSLRHTLPLLLSAVLGTGCASYNEQVDAAVEIYATGDFAEAAERLTSHEFADQRNGRRDGILLRLEAAKALLDAGRYEDSSAMFDRAANLMLEFDYAADISVSEEITALAGAQASRAYRGTRYDAIQLEVYETLNYMARNDLGEALVHTRKAFARQAAAVAANAAEISSRAKRARRDGIDCDRVLKDPGYSKARAGFQSLVNPAYADFVNPCASLLSALLLREDGDAANALVDLRKVARMVPGNSYLSQLLAEFEAANEPAQNRVYILLESGLAPVRLEERLTLISYRQGISRFAIPTLVPVPNQVQGLCIESPLAGNSFQSEHLASIESMVATDFAAALPGIVLRTLAALVAKEVVTHQLESKRDKNLGFLVANVWKAVTSQADLRTWRTMGAEYQLAVLPAPEDGRLDLFLVDRPGGRHLPLEILLPRARTTLIYVRSPSLTALGAHLMPIGPSQPRTASRPSP